MILVGGRSAQLRLVVKSLIVGRDGAAAVLDASSAEQIRDHIKNPSLHLAILAVDDQTLAFFDPACRGVPVIALHYGSQPSPDGAEAALVLPVNAGQLSAEIDRLLRARTQLARCVKSD